MDYCGQCGARLGLDQAFCHKCGASLSEQRAIVDETRVGDGSQRIIPPPSVPTGPLARRAVPRTDIALFTPRDHATSAAQPIQSRRSPSLTRRRQWGRYIALLAGVFLLSIMVSAIINPAPSTGHGQASVVASASTATDVPQATDVPTLTASQWAMNATKDSYADVRDHPDLYAGNEVVWTCQINKFLGADPNDTTSTDVTCGGFGDAISEAVLVVPFSIDTSSLHAGDTVTAYGTVAQPFQGTNGFGATITEPQITVVYLEDAATNAQATADAQTQIALLATATPTFEIITPMATDTSANLASDEGGVGPTAECNDGTTSYSQHPSGTCSYHGGVAVWDDHLPHATP